MLLLMPPRTKTRTAVLQLACTCRSPGDLIRDVDSDSVGLGVGLIVCFPNKLPEDEGDGTTHPVQWGGSGTLGQLCRNVSARG